uniref:Uncharacterized protein n=1 Tax=Meloidogyne enterolobii TaxID=390850 RepID=A0A6V7WAD5_MELEN|nr:unnamed protein product [Meloidogyne enterolobii]
MAMALAAYGAHFVSDNQNLSAERKRAMEHANKHHFNSIGIVLASVASRHPKVTSTLFALELCCFVDQVLLMQLKRTRLFVQLPVEFSQCLLGLVLFFK